MTAHVEELLAEYLLGVLGDGERRAVAAHLAACERCAAEAEALGAALGSLAFALRPQAPSPSARERLVADLDGAHRFDPFIDPLADLMDVPADQATRYLRDIRRPPSWQGSPWAGVRLVHVEGGPRTAGADVGFVEVQPGVRFPHHRHTGDEFSLVLQGSAREDTGAVYGPGDLVVRRAGTGHSFTALDGPVLVFAVVVFGFEVDEPS